MGAGGQVLPAGDQVPGHGNAVDVLKIGVLPDVGVAVGCQRGLDDGHIKPGIVRDEGFAGQEGMQLLPDGEKIRGVFRVLRVNSVDMNVALVISVAWRLDQVVAEMGLADRRNNLPSQLSGGQQQRVSIGRAIFNHPAIVLADEPTGNLDRRNSEEIIRLLKESNRRQKQTLIVITHDESIALQADRMLAIEDGRITRDERIRIAGGEFS